MMNVAVRGTHVHEAHEGLALSSISAPPPTPPTQCSLQNTLK